MSSTMETVWEESGGVHCTFPACMCPYGSPDESLRNTPVSHVAPPLLSHDFTPQSVSWHDDRARASSLLPPPSLWPRLTKERVFFFFYESDTRLTVKWINRTSHSCFSRDVTADVTRKCVLAFWKQIVWFLITLSCEHTDLIRPWFYFLSTPPNLPDTPGSSQAFFPGRIIAVCNLRQCILEETNTSRIIQKKEFLVEFFESNQVIFIHIAQKWAPWSLAKDGETSRPTTDQQHRYNNYNRL